MSPRLNPAQVSTADSIVVGASGQAGGNAITAGVADVLSHTPVLAHVNLVNQELALVNALDMKHAGGLRLLCNSSSACAAATWAG